MKSTPTLANRQAEMKRRMALLGPRLSTRRKCPGCWEWRQIRKSDGAFIAHTNFNDPQLGLCRMSGKTVQRYIPPKYRRRERVAEVSA